MEAPLGRPRRRQRRETVADTEFGFSGDLSEFAFGCATVCADVAHVAPERGGTTRRTRTGADATGAPVLARGTLPRTGGETGGTPTSTI